MQNISHIFKYINWNATWLFLNNNQKRSSNFTTFQLSHQKFFWIKNLLNELPTLSHLHQLYPNIFTYNNCLSCNSQEDAQHWLFCSNNQSVHAIPYIVEGCNQICLYNSLNIVMIYIFKDLKYLSKNLYMNIWK